MEFLDLLHGVESALKGSRKRTKLAYVSQVLNAHAHLSPGKTRQAIDFLLSAGLIRESRGELQPGESRIHLTDDSPMIAKHHANWRMQAIQALDREARGELHYWSVISISRDDQPRVREILLKAIEEVRKLVRDSKDEQVCCYAVDLFGVGTPQKTSA